MVEMDVPGDVSAFSNTVCGCMIRSVSCVGEWKSIDGVGGRSSFSLQRRCPGRQVIFARETHAPPHTTNTTQHSSHTSQSHTPHT